MGMLTSRINQMKHYESLCQDAAYDIVEVIKYNIDEPAGSGRGFGLTDTGWKELEETLKTYVDESVYLYNLMENITESVNPFIKKDYGEFGYDIDNEAYVEVCKILVNKRLLKPKE